MFWLLKDLARQTHWYTLQANAICKKVIASILGYDNTDHLHFRGKTATGLSQQYYTTHTQDVTTTKNSKPSSDMAVSLKRFPRQRSKQSQWNKL